MYTNRNVYLKEAYMKQRKFSNQQFINVIKNSYSIKQVLELLKLPYAGSSYRTFNILARQLKADYSHFTGQGHLKGKTHNWNKKIPLNKILIENSTYNNGNNLKKRLFKADLLENKCNRCSISKWQNESLSLHLDHINGIPDDNRIENLRLLCPNCHSLTPTYAGKNIKLNRKQKTPKKPRQPKPDKQCADCQKKISLKATKCKSCTGKCRPTKIQWPPTKQLIKMVERTSFMAVARKLNISDNAIRKRIKKHS